MSAYTINQLNYLMIFRMFADHFELSEKQTFNYPDRHKGFEFVKSHYEVMHTLDFDYAIENVREACQASGGRI